MADYKHPRDPLSDAQLDQMLASLKHDSAQQLPSAALMAKVKAVPTTAKKTTLFDKVRGLMDELAASLSFKMVAAQAGVMVAALVLGLYTAMPASQNSGLAQTAESVDITSNLFSEGSAWAETDMVTSLDSTEEDQTND